MYTIFNVDKILLTTQILAILAVACLIIEKGS